ncbi:MAG: 30S ribosomal protein S4 [bacterium]
MQSSLCQTCRRSGIKLFLKGERCVTAKCAIIKRHDPPGPRKKRRPAPLSEYGKQLREKQKLKNWYNLREQQLSNYVKAALKKRGSSEDPIVLLIKTLEGRLDNVIFRLGFAISRKMAKQMVTHGLFLVNGKPANIPSYQVKKSDIVSAKAAKIKKSIFQKISGQLKKHKAPSWLELNAEKWEGKVVSDPIADTAELPAEISSIFEFYSR